MAIFSGKVVKIERLKDGELRATVEIASAWKGEARGAVAVTTPPDGGACGFDFKEGQSYLVYAVREPDAGTRKPEEAKEDLEALGEAPAGKAKG